ncbi:hypothetical protein GCM10023323_18970 [Streptomyces thinghirensis]|uniref:Uncharacterized protein n=1 Tax=Streptomyces thinghirensis TaxID=551547 RepID=A0ABP9T1N0_9ACTN
MSGSSWFVRGALAVDGRAWPPGVRRRCAGDLPDTPTDCPAVRRGKRPAREDSGASGALEGLLWRPASSLHVEAPRGGLRVADGERVIGRVPWRRRCRTSSADFGGSFKAF